MTVETLFKMCVQEIKKGNGKKEIMISDDEEGNGYHELYYGFDTNVKELDMWVQLKILKTKLFLVKTQQ